MVLTITPSLSVCSSIVLSPLPYCHFSLSTRAVCVCVHGICHSSLTDIMAMPSFLRSKEVEKGFSAQIPTRHLHISKPFSSTPTEYFFRCSLVNRAECWFIFLSTINLSFRKLEKPKQQFDCRKCREEQSSRRIIHFILCHHFLYPPWKTAPLKWPCKSLLRKSVYRVEELISFIPKNWPLFWNGSRKSSNLKMKWVIYAPLVLLNQLV